MLKQQKRDLRRLQPLVSLILGNATLDPSSESFFTEAKRVSFVKVLIGAVGWRLNGLSELFCTYLDHAPHPYQQVRSVVGGVLNCAAQCVWVPGNASPLAAVAANLSNRSGAWAVVSGDADCVGDVPLVLDPRIKDAMDSLQEQMAAWRLLAKSAGKGPTNFSQAGKTRKSSLIQCSPGSKAQ